MLVLTINAEDKLHIGDDITIQFTPDPNNHELVEKRVKAAIEAPEEVLVLREELIEENLV